MNLKLIFIFVFAFLIRLIGLNQSLWLDEATTTKVVKQFSYLSIINQFSPFDFHPPLYYLLMKFWTSIFGYSEVIIRMPSVIFSLITGYIVYRIGKLLAGEEIGIWASLLFLSNPLIVYYSQEARMYMTTTMFLTGGVYYFLKYQSDKSNIKNIFFMNLCFLLSFFSFYGAIFLILAILFYLLYEKQYQNFLITFLFLLFSLILVKPLLNLQLTNAKIALTNVSQWSLVLGKANIKNLLLIPIKFSLGRIDFHPKWLYYLIAGLWTFYVIFSLFLNLKIKNYQIFILSYLLIFPIVFGFFISLFIPLLQYFRFLYLVPLLSLLLSFGEKFKKKILVSGFFIFSIIYLINPQFHREDWRSLVRSLKTHQPVYMILSSSDPLFYYRPDIKIYDLKKITANHLPKKISVIPYTASIHGVFYEKFLLSKNYSLIKKQSFHRLYLEEWEKLK